METIKYIYKKILLPCCLIFTVLTVIFTAVQVSGGDEYTSNGFTLGAIGQLFLFSLLMSGADKLFEIKNISLVLRFLMHYIALCLAFIITFIWLGGRKFSAKLMILAAVIYIIALGITLIVRAIRRSKENTEKEYNKQF